MENEMNRPVEVDPSQRLRLLFFFVEEFEASPFPKMPLNGPAIPKEKSV